MDIKTVRLMRKSLLNYQDVDMEFIPMFTSVLLDMLNAYEDEIKSLEDQLENAIEDVIHERERDE